MSFGLSATDRVRRLESTESLTEIFLDSKKIVE